MLVIGIIVSVIFNFLWSWMLLKAGAFVIGSKTGTWVNCAVLNAINFAVAGVLIGFALLVAQGPGLFIALLFFAALIGGIWLMVRATMSILSISFMDCIMLEILIWGFNGIASFLLSKLASVLPGMHMLTSCLPFLSRFGITG